MKNNKFKKLISCLAALALFLSIFSVVPVFAEDPGIIYDDFSSASKTEALWKTVASDGSAVSGVTARDGALSLPSGNGNITYVNDTDWSKYTVTEGRKLQKTQWQITADVNGETTARPVLYYNTVTKDYVYLVFYKHINFGWQLSYGANGSGRLSNNILYSGKNYEKTANNFLITAEYTYSEDILTSVKISVGFYSDSTFADSTYLGTNKAVITFTGANSANDAVTKGGISLDGVKTAVNTFRAGVVSGNSQANTDGIKFHSVRIGFEQTVAEFSSVYKAKYAEVLGKTTDTVTETDLSGITAAISEYRTFTAAQQTELSEQYTLLIELKQKLYKDVYGEKFNVNNDIFDDFESYSDTLKPQNIWSAFDLTQGNLPTVQPSISYVEGSNRFKSYQGSGIAAVVDDGLWLDRSLSGFECDILVPETANSTSGAQYVYSYIDTNARTYIANEYTRSISSDRIQVRLLFSSKFTRSSGGITTQLYASAGWDPYAPLHLSAQYILVNDKKIRVIMKTTQGELSHTYDFTFTCAEDYAYQQSGFKAGFSSASSNGLCYIDNVAFSFELNAQDYADRYLEKYSELLSKTADEISSADYDAVYNALLDYTELSVDSQTILSAEKALLNQMALKLDSSVADFLNRYSDLFNTPIDNIDHSFDSDIDSALSEYENLSAMGKLVANKTYLNAIKEKLVNLIVPTGENYDPIKIDFEYNYFPFVETPNNNFTANSTLEIVKDPTDETGENSVLKIAARQNDTIFYAVNPDLWPVQGQMTNLNFRLYVDGVINSFSRFGFVYDYLDEENYAYFELTGGGTGKSRPAYTYIEGGEGGSKNIGSAGTANTDGWMEFNFHFFESYIRLTAYYSGNDKSYIYELPYRAGSKIGFIGNTQYGHPMTNTYLDDIEIEFKRGDFDANQVIDDIDVYFSGNSFLNEGETLYLSGETLGNVLDSLSIYRVNDADVTEPAFVDFGNYEKSSVSEAKVTAASEFNFDDAQATELEIIQKTKYGVKAVIPNGLTSSDGGTGPGVYAVKATAKSGKSKVLLINTPWYNFYTGDEGKIVTPGNEVEVIGYNLTPTGDVNDIKVAMKSVATSEITYFGADSLTVKSNDNHYLKIKIPENFVKGEYELYVHSGLGNELCWTPPIIVTVGTSPRASWPTNVYKASDFGATGDGDTNDTAAILNALNAAFLNGGGIIEFDEGIYRIDATLPIPTNTVLRGKGSGRTTFLYTAYKWQNGEARDMLSIIGNCEITGIQFYSTRSGYFCYTNAVNSTYTRFTDKEYASQPNDNIYFNDVKFRCFWTEGAVTGGGFGFSSNVVVNFTELYNILKAESALKEKLSIGSKSTNVRINNLDLYVSRGGNAGARQILGDYIYVNGFSNNSWTQFIGFNTYAANIIAEQICLGIQASHGYFTESKLGMTDNNNREAFTTDGGPKATGVKVRFIGNDPDLMEEYTGKPTTDNVTYALIGRTLGVNAWNGYSMLVTKGQGFGQLRMICGSSEYTNPQGEKFYTLKVESPYTISPNRNSTCTIIDQRDSMVCTNVNFYECNAGAIYGSGINWTFENYTFDTAAGPSLTNCNGYLWYVTFNNTTGINANGYVHGEGYGGTSGTYQTGNAAIRLYGQTAPSAFAMMGVTIKNCDLGQYRINITTAGITSSVADVIIETNRIDGAKNAIKGGGPVNGLLVRANSFDVTDSYAFTDSVLRAAAAGTYNGKNIQGYKTVIVILGEGTAAGMLAGDVNGDGKISLKDSTLVKLYILELVELDGDSLKRADVNNDGAVTNRDANQIRRYILEGTPFSDVTPSESESSSEESSSSGSSSSESSSSSSSSESSSSESSSSSSSSESSSSESSSSSSSSESSSTESSSSSSSSSDTSSSTSSDEYFNGIY